MSEIRRGEIYWVDWNPGRGSEQSGIRPSLIIQNNTGNRFGTTTIIAAITTSIGRLYPFMVRISPKESNLPKESAVDLAEILTIDFSRLGSKCGQLGQDKMAEIDKAIKISLGLS